MDNLSLLTHNENNNDIFVSGITFINALHNNNNLRIRGQIIIDENHNNDNTVCVL